MVRLLLTLQLVCFLLTAASGAARSDLQEGINAYFDGDYAAAVAALTPEAEGGDVVAQFFLGEIYLHGKGVAQDFAQAAQWYERAAEQGHPEAQAALGSLQMLGLGVPKQPSSAYFWLIVSVVWEDSQLREDAMWGLGEVAPQLSREQKAEIARAALPQWKRAP